MKWIESLTDFADATYERGGSPLKSVTLTPKAWSALVRELHPECFDDTGALLPGWLKFEVNSKFGPIQILRGEP